MLGVRKATANRAMQLLADRGLIVRRQRMGTLIARPTFSRQTVRTVYVLATEDQKPLGGFPYDLLAGALRQEMGGVNVQFSFIPTQEAAGHVRSLLGPAQDAGQLAGAVPISCPREVYRLLEEMGVPTVVFGSLYPDQRKLASIDEDCHEAGRLLADYLVRHGRRRIALLTTARPRPGEAAFFDGISDALTAACMPHNALLMRIMAPDEEGVRAQLRDLLTRDDRPAGLIVRRESVADLARAVAGDCGLRVPQELLIVLDTPSTDHAAALTYPHVKTATPFDELARQAARMLKHLTEGHPLYALRLKVPVALTEPDPRLAG